MTVFAYIQRIVEEGDEEELKRLLRFTTGGEMLNPCGIKADVSPDSNSIYACNFLCELVIPQ